MDILLIDWWWRNRGSTSLTFWFQPVWGLRACGQHAVNFFYLVGVSVSAKQLKGHGSEQCLEEEPKVLDFVQWLNYYYFVLLDCFSFFLHFLTSLIKFILWLKFFYRQKAGGGHGVQGLFWEVPIGSCSVTKPLCFLTVWASCFSWRKFLWQSFLFLRQSFLFLHSFPLHTLPVY